jgi:hypothetical protein
MIAGLLKDAPENEGPSKVERRENSKVSSFVRSGCRGREMKLLLECLKRVAPLELGET